MWRTEYADPANGFHDPSSVGRAEFYLNGRSVEDFTREVGPQDDAKKIFYHVRGDCARVVNVADGYALTLPTVEFTPDYRLSALRSRYTAQSFVVTVSYEDKSPYGDTERGWLTYRDEWITRYIADDTFLSYNRISRTRPALESDTLLPGYSVLRYDTVIEDAGDIAMPFSHIAVIRPENEYARFFLIVMSSETNAESTMDAMVRSFREIPREGTAKNREAVFPCEVPEYWNAETKAYYQKLREQKTVDWGFFSASMVDEEDPEEYERQAGRIEREYARLTAAVGAPYGVMPTYTHIAWGDRINHFPSKMAALYAGGNGFNGKPVLQFTYQFTTHNNTELNRYTPMFDILRGRFDETFRALAREIRAYGKPVLFRLNNEMNSDWTSYCGLVTLLDPSLFVQSWERLYRLFREEGVDNTIWIFNPVAKSTPYSRWGEDLCYLPDLGTVQLLGLTAYEPGNGISLRPFEEIYRELSEKNSPYFDLYPAIISEFGAGAGGEQMFDTDTKTTRPTRLGRNAGRQAKWIEEMFRCLARADTPQCAFCRQIKAAVWFNCNDYTVVDGKPAVTNYYDMDEGTPDSLGAFRRGLDLTRG